MYVTPTVHADRFQKSFIIMLWTITIIFCVFFISICTNPAFSCHSLLVNKRCYYYHNNYRKHCSLGQCRAARLQSVHLGHWVGGSTMYRMIALIWSDSSRRLSGLIRWTRDHLQQFTVYTLQCIDSRVRRGVGANYQGPRISGTPTCVPVFLIILHYVLPQRKSSAFSVAVKTPF